MTARAAEIAEAEMIAAGHGPAPADYALLVLGSGGRGESLLAPDQDNALVICGWIWRRSGFRDRLVHRGSATGSTRFSTAPEFPTAPAA